MAEVGMHYCDITETHDPFGFLNKFAEVQLIDDPHQTISTPGTHDGTGSSGSSSIC